MTLWRLILWSLGSTSVSFLVNRQGDYNALFDTVGASRIRGETFEILMMKVLRSPNLHTDFPKRSAQGVLGVAQRFQVLSPSDSKAKGCLQHGP